MEGKGNCGNRRAIAKDRDSERERKQTNADWVDHMSEDQVKCSFNGVISGKRQHNGASD